MKILGWIFAIILSLLLLFFASNKIYNHYCSISYVFTPHPAYPENARRGKNLTQSTIRILVINGGGVNGLMPLYVLQYLEKKTGQPISELFDLFVGTSTGAIITSALNLPDENGAPKFNVNQIIAAYRSFSKEIMHTSWARKIFTLNGILGPEFSTNNLNRGLEKRIGKNVLFSQLINKVSIVAFNLNNMQLQQFNSWDSTKVYSNYSVSDLLTAATAAPGLYSSVILNKEIYIDGGTLANNPLLYSLRNAIELYPNASEFIIVHLGTGHYLSKNTIDKWIASKNITAQWGWLQWAKSVVSIIYSSQDTEVQEAVRDLKLMSLKSKFKNFYFSKDIVGGSPYDTSNQHLELIKITSYQLIKEQEDKLNRLSSLLTNHP